MFATVREATPKPTATVIAPPNSAIAPITNAAYVSYSYLISLVIKH